MATSILADLEGFQRRIEEILGASSGGSALPLLHEAWSITIRFMLLYQRQRYLLPDEQARHLHTLIREKLDLADLIGTRITQLGGAPDYSAERMTGFEGSHGVQTVACPPWLADNLTAEQKCSELWTRAAGWLAERDSLSQKVFQSARDAARRHAGVLEDLIKRYPDERGRL